MASAAATAATTAPKSEDKKPKYVFSPASFPPVVFMPLHLDLTFDVQGKNIVVTNRTTFEYRGDGTATEISLNARFDGFDVKAVQVYATSATPCSTADKNFEAHVAGLAGAKDAEYEKKEDDRLLVVKLPSAVKTGEQVSLRVVSEVHPNDSVLEGVYTDHTLDGKPTTYITQCQQVGFQRITPSVDRMAAKTYYTTTIIADKAYDNMISNGDLAPGYFDPATGLPVYHSVEEVTGEKDDTRHVLKYHNHKVCMSSYLFFFGVGCWSTYYREVEYPDGVKVTAELLVYEDRHERQHAVTAINALHDHILWTYVSTGPEMYEHQAEQATIYALIQEREALKEAQRPLVLRVGEAVPAVKELSAVDAARLQEVRAELAQLIGTWTNTGYQYTGQVYREIAMENSDYGGMENVGNTTIMSAMMVPSYYMSDRALMYYESVKIHEYYHNINGSQVTGMTPFQIWLNEAVTVHMERKRAAELFGDTFRRLVILQYMFTPSSGPLAQDAGALAMPIEPAGYNRTQELISAMTYSKAPEFVQMIETLLTPPVFARGLHRYHTKFAYKNALTSDWIEAMEEESGLKLQEMARGWLKRSNHPQVSYTTKYDAAAKTMTVTVTQTGFESGPADNNGPWEFPVDWALVKDGAATHQGMLHMKAATETIVVSGVEAEPDFASIGRKWSFFGETTLPADTAVRVKQAMSDPDIVNRYIAFRSIANEEKARIVRHLCLPAADRPTDFAVSETYLKLHAALLADDSVPSGEKGVIMYEDAGVPGHDDLRHRYKEIAAAVRAMAQAVFAHNQKAIQAKLAEAIADSASGDKLKGIHGRRLERALLVLHLAAMRPPILSVGGGLADVGLPALCESMMKSPAMTEREMALQYAMACAEDPTKVIDAEEAAWTKDAVAVYSFIVILAALDHDSAPDAIRRMMNKAPWFKLSLAAHARSLCRAWSVRRDRCLLTDDGLNLTVEIAINVAQVNEMSCAAILAAFGDIARFEGEDRTRLVNALLRIYKAMDPAKHQSTCNRVTQLLESVDVKVDAATIAAAGGDDDAAAAGGAGAGAGAK